VRPGELRVAFAALEIEQLIEDERTETADLLARRRA
jgi:hypothetical protein